MKKVKLNWKNILIGIIVLGALGSLFGDDEELQAEQPLTQEEVAIESETETVAEEVEETEADPEDSDGAKGSDAPEIVDPIVTEGDGVGSDTTPETAPFESPEPDATDQFSDHRLIEVGDCDLSGSRQPNVMVNVGFGDREYWAYTNEYGQLVRVVAKEIILQNDDIEPVLSTGRYCYDEAKVPGTESSTLDEGHVIADSLGGVSNAYNITPQNSTLNRHGDQAYMERNIREAGGASDFEAIITYPNTETQIPSEYAFTYTILGNVIHDEFPNGNPDELNQELIEEQQKEDAMGMDPVGDLEIIRVDLSREEVEIVNNGEESLNLEGYVLVSTVGNQQFAFPEYFIEPGDIVTVFSGKGSGDLKWTGSYIWNNDGDPAELYGPSGELLDWFGEGL